MNTEIKRAGNGIVCVVKGIINTAEAANQFAALVRADLQSPTAFIVVDVAQASLPDSRFLSRIVELYTASKQKGPKVYLMCGKNALTRELFELMSFDRMMPIIEDLKDAI